MNPRPLKIISVNIEMDRHFDRLLSFFDAQQPDVILLQEVLRKDVSLLENATHMQGIYTVQNILYSEKSENELGLLTLCKLPILKNKHVFYRGDGSKLVRMTAEEPEKTARALTMVETVKDQQPYCLLNTHFTWTPHGRQPNADQQQDIPVLLKLLAEIPDFILCGDFNAPRGTLIFDKLAAKYTDNIPLDVSSTIDKQLHRCGDLGLVVDGVFTTPGYEVTDIQVYDQLSDHCAIVTSVRKVDYVYSSMSA